MLHENKRWVYIFDLTLSPIPIEAPRFHMTEVAKRIEIAFKSNEAFHLTHDGDVSTRITGLEIQPETRSLELLVQYANRNASDPVFANLRNGDLREEPKLKGEGVAVSAHMIISLDPTHPSGDQYIAVLEDVPGLTRSHIKPFLTAIFRQAYDSETFRDPDTKSIKKCRPAADLSSHTDQTMDDVLSGKKLQSITLTGYEEVTSLDEDTYLKPVDRSIKLKVIKEPDDVVDWLKKLRKKSSDQGFDDMRVFYKDPSRSNRQQQSIKLEKKQDAAAALFTRMEEVTVGTNLKQCHPELNRELCGKMNMILEQTRQVIQAKKKQ